MKASSKKNIDRHKTVGSVIDRVMAVHDIISEVRERCTLMADSLNQKKPRRMSLPRTREQEDGLDVADSKQDFKTESSSNLVGGDIRRKQYVDENLAAQLERMRFLITNQITNFWVRDRLLGFLNEYEKLQNHERELSNDRSRVLQKLRLDMMDSRFDYFSDNFPTTEHMPYDTLCNPELTADVRTNSARLQNLGQLEKRLVNTETPIRDLVQKLTKTKAECEGVNRKLDIEQHIKTLKGPMMRLKETLVFLTPELYVTLPSEDRKKMLGMSVLFSRNLKKLHTQRVEELEALAREFEEKTEELQHMVKVITELNKKKGPMNNKRAELVEWCTHLMHQMNQIDKTIKKGTEHSVAGAAKLKEDVTAFKSQSDNPVKLLHKMIDALSVGAFSSEFKMKQPWDDEAAYISEDDKVTVTKLLASFDALQDLNTKWDEEMSRVYKITNKFVPKGKYGPINMVWKVPANPEQFLPHVAKCLNMLTTTTELMADVVDFRLAVCEGINSLNQVKLMAKSATDVIMFDLCQNIRFEQMKEKLVQPSTHLHI